MKILQQNLNIVIAADSFKGSASSFEVNRWIANGIHSFLPTANIIQIPMADGGEGTLAAIISTRGGKTKKIVVTGPLGKKVNAHYGLLDEKTAILEMAEASGLTLVDESQLDPYKASSYGTGQLLKAALDEGVKEIYIGIGGSATNDGGLGMAQALGYEFKDAAGNDVGFGAQAIDNIKSISKKHADPRLKQVKIHVLSDVTNRLLGKNGASYVYGRQKGAKEEDLVILDQLLSNFSQLIASELGEDVSEIPGSGAAGGLGAGLLAFCSAKMTNGVEQILDLLAVDRSLAKADLVITGEGRIDAQSFYGKAPIGMAQRAKNYELPVIAVVGSVSGDISAVYQHGIDLVLTTVNRPMSLQEAVNSVQILLENAGQTAIRSFLLN